jgi:hypothetical protein
MNRLFCRPLAALLLGYTLLALRSPSNAEWEHPTPVPKEAKIVVIPTHNEHGVEQGLAIEFRDENDRLVNKIDFDHPYYDQPINGDEDYYLLSQVQKDYVIVVVQNSSITSDKEYFNTGYEKILHNKIRLFDRKGHELYSLENRDYWIVSLKANGYAVGYKYGVEYYSRPVNDKLSTHTPETKLVLIDRKGKEVVFRQQGDIDPYTTAVSQNGKWFLYRAQDEKGAIQYWIESTFGQKQLYKINLKVLLGKGMDVLDDGTINSFEYVKRLDKITQQYKKYHYDPRTLKNIYLGFENKYAK